ncbi:hypothetical protein HYU20_01155 [Candidatus Woesearchaeota archaeon]|nr:hypothetical protein [Candidatus Woesearchaeota archaeon]
MAAYGRSGEVRKMGIGAMIVRGAVVTAAGGLLYAAVLNPIMDRISGSSAVVETGYVNPKALSVQGKKNGTGNLETFLNYKNGDEVVSLPCKKGPSGPLCGAVDYWWQSVGADQREGLAVNEWPSISNNAKHGIMSAELQTILDAFYGAQKAQQQYDTPKK